MTSAATTPRTVHVEHCMGTVFTIDIRDEGEWREAIAEVVTFLHTVDAVFSTYKHDSDISRIRRNELRVDDAHPDVATVLELCARAQTVTGGVFSAMPEGRLDPTGLVKGWSISRAGTILSAHGAINHAVNGGGDMQLTGEAAPGRPWRVGIVDPSDRTTVHSVAAGRDFALATSGVAERGAHIVDPFTGRAPTGVLSATVAGPSATFADAYATAAFVLGRSALPWIRSVEGYEAMLVLADGTTLHSDGWARRFSPSSELPGF